jgi:drug/metabolite transporter (DMT)-like permease
MQTLLLVSWSAMVISSIAVTAVAMGLWFRDVLRERDTDGVEPSPLSKRSAIYSVLALSVFIGIRLARGESVSVLFAGFTAVFIGFALSASWYLLQRRATDTPSPRQVDKLSAIVAASFGALSALTPLT